MPPKVSSGNLRKLARLFEAEHIKTDGSVIRCDICDCPINVDYNHQKDRLQQHVDSVGHVNKKARLDNMPQAGASQQQFIGAAFDASSKKSQFNADLCAAFLQADIPLFKLQNPALRSFLEKYTHNEIPDESTLRQGYVEPVYKETISRVRAALGDSPVFFVLDETTDAIGRNVLNVLVGPLNGKPVKAMLFKSYDLDRTNNATIMQSFNDTCSRLWPNGIQYDKIRLVVTDQAPYMVLAFQNLKLMYTKLSHVTCLAHALHRVGEALRDEYTKADKFMAEMKKVLLKAPSRIQIYKDEADLPLPKHPIVTRWGTWINCAVFYCENYDKMKLFVAALQNDSKAVERLKELVIDPDVQDELFNIAIYKSIPDAIAALEEQLLPKERQWQIFSDIADGLDGIAKDKIQHSLSRNPDVLNFATNQDLQFRTETRFAPLVSVDVERSFSLFKNILTDKRHNLTLDKMEMYNVIGYNRFLF